MNEERVLFFISAIKRLHRPCTALDLAMSLGVTRAKVNPILYEFQKLELVKMVRECNPPKWDLTPTGNLYTYRNNAVQISGRSKCGLSSSSAPTATQELNDSHLQSSSHIDSPASVKSLPTLQGDNNLNIILETAPPPNL